MPCEHVWTEEYYGWLCVTCGLFYPYGCAPWDAPESHLWNEYDQWDTWEHYPESEDDEHGNTQ